jgi:hypothetical protein
MLRAYSGRPDCKREVVATPLIRFRLAVNEYVYRDQWTIAHMADKAVYHCVPVMRKAGKMTEDSPQPTGRMMRTRLAVTARNACSSPSAHW